MAWHARMLERPGVQAALAMPNRYRDEMLASKRANLDPQRGVAMITRWRTSPVEPRSSPAAPMG